MPLIDLVEARAELAPDAPCIRDDAGELDNAAFAARVADAAASLAARGIRPGDVVAIKLSNRVELIVLLFAAWRLGAVVTPVNPALGPVETGYQVGDAGAALLVVETQEDAATGAGAA
ncbi:MAG: AMP-binding protein, partial [Microbacterium sp.]|nr:AMP-binding protein [Microbacterium sp.]